MIDGPMVCWLLRLCGMCGALRRCGHSEAFIEAIFLAMFALRDLYERAWDVED